MAISQIAKFALFAVVLPRLIYLRIAQGILLAMIVCQSATAQKYQRVENTHSIKSTFLGLSYAYEHGYARESALNFELAVAGGFGSSFIRGNYWLIGPVLRLENRYYYNYLYRMEKGKKTVNNAANYLALSADYVPGISIGKNAEAVRSFTLLSKWGLKRAMGNHFIFEFAAGPGAMYSETDGWSFALAIDLKFGYTF
ncbi:MAG: hypothetical protein JXQ80_12430 [Bacteroidales bacterium]|nr:hypothetical protein [Bacteroidales bacterium]